MAENFIEPSTASKTRSSSKSFIYDSYPNDRIVSPYDGEVLSVDDRECEGNVKIKHNLNGKILVSNFCGVGKSMVLSGQKIYKGKTIGYFGDNVLTFSVLDNIGMKKNLTDLFKNVESQKTDIKKKSENKDSKSRVSKSYPNKYEDIISKVDIGDVVKDLMYLPKTAIEKLTGILKKKKEDDTLSEEIKRIKQLLK